MISKRFEIIVTLAYEFPFQKLVVSFSFFNDGVQSGRAEGNYLQENMID